MTKLSEEFERLRKERGLSVNQVSIYAEVDRNTLARLQANRAPRLELLEKIARYLDADVNRWRKLAGYPPVQTPNDLLNEGLLAIQEETGRLPLVSGEELRLAQDGLEEAQKVLDAARRRANRAAA